MLICIYVSLAVCREYIYYNNKTQSLLYEKIKQQQQQLQLQTPTKTTMRSTTTLDTMSIHKRKTIFGVYMPHSVAISNEWVQTARF